MYFGMSDFNYTAVESSIIATMTQMAFGSSDSLWVCDGGSLYYCYVLMIVVTCTAKLGYNTWKGLNIVWHYK